MRRSVLLRLHLCGAALVATGCPVSSDLPADEVCRDAGFSIANRLFECTGDGDRANAGYETLLDEGRCLVTGFAKDELGASNLTLEGGATIPVTQAYACPGQLRALACDVIQAGESAPGIWLSQAPSCAPLFAIPVVGDAGTAP